MDAKEAVELAQAESEAFRDLPIPEGVRGERRNRSGVPSVQQPADETTEILADPAAMRGLAEAHESEQAGDVIYGVEAVRELLAERKR